MKGKWLLVLILGLVSLLAIQLPACTAEPSPTIAFSPATFSFNTQDGETNPSNDVLQISNSGGGTLNWLVSDDATWLTLSPTSGSNTSEVDEVIVSVNISALNAGNYTATITISAQGVPSNQTALVELAIAENPRHVYTDGAIEVGGDGEPIELINNPNAANPTYAELIAFIEEDFTDAHLYADSFDVLATTAEVPYVCSDFAEDVHNNAEAAGIRAAWVGIEFVGEEVGHALNAFETTDRGLVYIDCTGGNLWEWLAGHILVTEEGDIIKEENPTGWDKVAYLEVGMEYGVIDIAQAESPSYSFYEEYKQKWQEYDELVSDYNDEVTRYNQEISGKVYYEGSSELARIEAWEARLDEMSQLLDDLAEELGDYWFEPLGIVENISIHWGNS